MRKGFEVQCICGGRGPKFGAYGSFLPTRERRPACDMEQMEVGAARCPVTSCKTEKGPMTGYVKKPRREIGHKDGFDGSKIIESFKGGNKFGLSEASTDKEMNALNDERNGVPKDAGLGWTHEKILVNTKHLKDIMENKKKCDVNISKESMKEENKKVTKYKFKESEKESLLGNMRHKKSAKISGKGFHASGADHNIGHVNIKKETSMVHCTEGTNQAGRGHFDRGLSRVIESQKKRDIAGEKKSEKLKHVSNFKACVSKEVDTRSLPGHQNLRPKFTGYGSVLPMNKQYPARHLQEKNAVPVPNYSSQKTGNEGAVEKAPMSVMSAMPAKIYSFTRVYPSFQETAVNGAERDESHTMKRMAVLGDGTDGKQKKVRFSSKLDSETFSDPKKSPIYCALGLERSLPMSVDSSLDKEQMNLF